METVSRYSEERLLFRRQFILGPRFVDALPGWNRMRVRESICLTVHPDLASTQATAGGKSITVLGYVLDSSDPRATDAEIADRLLRRLIEGGSVSDLIRATEPLGGRWVLIVDDGLEVRLFHDAMGLRQVFFTASGAVGRAVWCASQPGLLAEALGLERNGAAELEYAHSGVYREAREYLWPGDTCVYRQIRHLLPNHSLDLLLGSCARYWPDRPVGHLSLDDGVEGTCRLLTSLILAAANRFPLALATTAGWDTRLLLAASREVAARIDYYTIYRRNKAADVTIPPRLLGRLGLRHHFVECPKRMEPDFERLYKRNVTEAHDFWGAIAQGLYDSYPQERVSVTGSAAEITRVRFRLAGTGEVTATDLARLSYFGEQYRDRLEANPFVVDAWERWLRGVNACEALHILDLFYWEHYAGNFAAMAVSEWDIVQEAFTPYDCRLLLTTMLAVDEKHREHDDPRLYREAIRKLWPEVLREPVNEPYEGPWTNALRMLRRTQLNRLVPRAAKTRFRKLLGIE